MRNFHIIFFLAFSFLFQIIRFFLISPETDYVELSITLVIVVLSLLSFATYNESYNEGNGQTFRISYLFLLGFLIVHFQMYVDYILGNYSSFRNDYFFGGEDTSKAAIVSSLGLISFLLGYLSSIRRTYRAIEPSLINTSSAGYMQVTASLCLFLFIVTADKRYFSGGYGNVELSPLAVHTQTFLSYFIVAVISVKTYMLKVLNTKVSLLVYLGRIGWFFNALVLVYLFLVLTSGDRGPIIQTCLVYFAGYVFSQNIRVKLVYLLTLIFSAALFITFLGEVRALTSGLSYSDKIADVQSNSELRERNSSFSPNTHELAISVRTVHAALDYVDENGYGYGKVQLNQLLAIFPGMGRLIRQLFELDGNDLISADIITSHLNANHGMGTSTITDLYIDLSIPGVVLGLFIFGMVVRRADVISFTSYVPSLFFWVVVLVLISKSIYIGRSSIMILLREILTIYLLILICGGRRQAR